MLSLTASVLPDNLPLLAPIMSVIHALYSEDCVLERAFTLSAEYVIGYGLKKATTTVRLLSIIRLGLGLYIIATKEITLSQIASGLSVVFYGPNEI